MHHVVHNISYICSSTFTVCGEIFAARNFHGFVDD